MFKTIRKLSPHRKNVISIVILFILLCALSLSFFGWYSGIVIENEVEYGHTLNELQVVLSGGTKDGVTAVTTINNVDQSYENNIFFDFLASEMETISKNTESVEEIKISEYVPPTGKHVIVEINYVRGTSKMTMNETLDNIKKELESKWYVSNVYYSGPGRYA